MFFLKENTNDYDDVIKRILHVLKTTEIASELINFYDAIKCDSFRSIFLCVKSRAGVPYLFLIHTLNVQLKTKVKYLVYFFLRANAH